MEIILVRDVDNLGLAGQVLKVAPGYARNFLLPTGAALPASPSNLKMLAKKRAEFEARAKAEKEQSTALKNKLADLRLSFRRKAGEKDKLYGAVTAMDLAEALKADGFDIDRKRLRLAEPIKTLGDFEVPVRLHQDVIGSFRVQVLPEDEVQSEGGQKAPTEKPADKGTAE